MIPSGLHRRGRGLASRFPTAGWPWLVPGPVAAFLLLSPLHRVELGAAALLGLGVVLLAAHWPDRALLTLLALLPFNTLALAQLYSLGVPGAVVRPLSGWKEALVLGIVLAGVRGFHWSRRRFDALDWLALGFVTIVGAYAVFGPMFLPQAPAGTGVRLLGLRQSAIFVILLMAARHARFEPGFAERAMRVVLGVSAVVAAVGVFEFFFSSSWNDFVVKTVVFWRYQLEVLQVQPFNPFDYRIYGQIGDRQIVRIGSVFLSSASCGFYLVIGFAIALQRVLVRGARIPLLGALVLIGGALILTLTRSAVLGALVVSFLALRLVMKRGSAQRTRVALILVAGALLAVPAAWATGLAARTVHGVLGQEESAVEHVEAFFRGVQVVAERPLGQGLGTSAGTGQRFPTPNVVVPENNYLQVGNELGLVTMLVFIALTVAFVRHLRRAAHQHDDPAAAALSGAAVALALGAFFLHVWNDFSVAWTLWGLGGAVLSLAAHQVGAEASEPAGESRPALPSPGRSPLPSPSIAAGRYAGGR